MEIRKLSRVPDLIYPACRERRIYEIEDYLRNGNGSLPSAFHRVVLFVTYRCNLRCAYCKTIERRSPSSPPTGKTEYDLARFEDLLGTLSPVTIRHIHFTGGEATLVKDLPAMVRAASEKGILCSLTTNGTAPVEVYRELVENGLAEVRLSLDTPCAEDFDRRVGRRGAHAKAMSTLGELTRLRDEQGRDVFIIINACIGYEDRRGLAEIIGRFVERKPNDIKLITMVQAATGLGDFEERQETVQRVYDMVAPLGEDRFPLLRYKLQTLFDKEAIGLKDAESRYMLKHCFLSLTERTMDAAGYYPCSVYLREGGAPLGDPWKDGLLDQQRKISAFVRSASCIDDPICRDYCIHCCKKFNLSANSVINGTLRDPRTGREEAIELEGRCEEEIPYRKIVARTRRIEEERKGFPVEAPFSPFLVIKPSGMPVRDRIRELIAARGITVRSTTAIADWNETAMRIYNHPLTEWKVLRGMVMEKVLPLVEATTTAEVLWLDGHHGIEALKALKAYIRGHFPSRRCLIRYGDDLIVTTLGYIHSPDEASYAVEYNVLTRGSIDTGNPAC